MRRYWVTLFATLALLSPASAQCTTCNGGAPAAPLTPAAVAPAAPVDGGCINDRPGLFGDGEAHGCCIRAEADFLLWWFRPNESASPLIGSYRGATLSPGLGGGSLNDPRSVVLFGGNKLETGPYSGYRLTFALDPTVERPIGAEVSGFWFPEQGERYGFASNGSTPLVLYSYNPNVANGQLIGETRTIVAGSGTGPGFATVDTELEIYGGDANLSFLVCREAGVTMTGMIGFRYAAFDETFTLRASQQRPGGITWADQFETTTRFYGGQIGGRMMYDAGPFRLGLLSKMALGWNVQELDISGFTTGGGQPPRVGGFYTARSNIGDGDKSRFAYLGETNLFGNVQLTDCVNVGVGYSFFYWNSVLRTGDEVNRLRNPNQAGNPAWPFRRYEESVFWAHGLNFTFGLNF